MRDQEIIRWMCSGLPKIRTLVFPIRRKLGGSMKLAQMHPPRVGGQTIRSVLPGHGGVSFDF